VSLDAVDFEQMFETVRREVTAVTAVLREAPGPAPGVPDDRVGRPGRLGDLPGLPVDPVGQAWEQILAAVLAEGPPEDPFDPSGGASRDLLGVLRVAGAPAPVGDLDGPAVAAALDTIDLTAFAVSDGEVVAAVAAASRLAAWAAGREVAATAELTARAARWRGVGPLAGIDGVEELLSARDLAALEVAAALGVSAAAADDRVERAGDLARLPGTRLALAGGRIDLAKARAIVEAVAPLDDAAAAAVEARVLGRAPGQTLPNLKACLARAVIAADPAAAETRRLAKAAARGVSRWRDGDCGSVLQWHGSDEEIEGFWLWLTCAALAARGPRATDDRSLDQVRSDVLADLGARGLDRSLTDTGAPLPTRKGRRPQIGVVVAASTLLGLDEEPGELVGVGPVTAALARRIAAEGTWRRLLTDPRTGRLDEVSAQTYAPPQDMVDHVTARDGTCRGIGCRISASLCDLDHEIPWPAGPTAVSNLQALHQRHHDLKTHTDTTVTTDPDGTTVWTLPSGRVYRVPPHQPLQHPDLDPAPLRAALRALLDTERQARQRRQNQDRADRDGGHLGGRDGPPPHDTTPQNEGPPEDDAPPF
jgi:hypothetical protein